MPSMPSGLPRSVMTWVSQVSVSVGATLVATMIYGALPRATVPRLEPAPEMTSGGKFAARALPPDALQASGGLDTMPSPRMAVPTAVLPTAVLTSATQPAVVAPWTAGRPAAPTVSGLAVAGSPVLEPLRRVLGDGGPTGGVPVERPVRAVKALRPPLRAEAKHAARVVVADIATPEPVEQVPSSEPVAKTDDGVLATMMSRARGALSVTASASDALLAHVMPQIP